MHLDKAKLKKIFEIPYSAASYYGDLYNAIEKKIRKHYNLDPERYAIYWSTAEPPGTIVEWDGFIYIIDEEDIKEGKYIPEDILYFVDDMYDEKVTIYELSDDYKFAITEVIYDYVDFMQYYFR